MQKQAVLRSWASFRNIQGLNPSCRPWESGSWASRAEGAPPAFNLCTHSPAGPALDPVAAAGGDSCCCCVISRRGSGVRLSRGAAAFAPVTSVCGHFDCHDCDCTFKTPALAPFMLPLILPFKHPFSPSLTVKARGCLWLSDIGHESELLPG